MKKTVLKWELSGIIFVFLVGALLHFVFEWSGNSGIVGVFASVNESVWEHFKQGFWPMCLYAAIEYIFLRKYSGNFLAAKAVAVYALPVITGLIFYTYTAFTGTEILIVDILAFLAAVIIAQVISYKIWTSITLLPGYANYISIAFIAILAAILITFTFYPPHWPIFMDHTGIYGIPK